MPNQTEQNVIADAQAVYNLLIELQQAKKEKKTLMKMHTENVKRIQAEIDEIIDRNSSDDEPAPATE